MCEPSCNPPADVDRGAGRRPAELRLRLSVGGDALVEGVHQHIGDGDAIRERDTQRRDPCRKSLTAQRRDTTIGSMSGR